MRGAAIAGGWLYAAALVFLTLTPKLPDPGVDYDDKLGHLLGYGLLMFWFCCLYGSRSTRLAYGMGWIAMGIALEFAQGAAGHRTFEAADMVANSLGVLVGWAISPTRRR